MSRLVLVLLLLGACAGETTTVTPAPNPTRASLPPVTTTTPTVDMSIQDCSTPPVTFSALCEVYDLLETWYVDAPIDDAALADLAVRGLDDYVATTEEEPPRTLFCAIPDQAFVALCDALAQRVEETGIPVEDAVEAAMSHMIETGLGPFTYYVPPEQAGSLRPNGVVGGIGALLDARDAVGSKCARITGACLLEVVVVFEGNPGFEAGLVEGDVIVAIDHVPVEGMGFTAAVAAIADDETGTVTLTIDRGGAEMELVIERAPFVVPTVEIELPRDNVGYIRIPDFEADIPGLVLAGLEELAVTGVGTIVVDLRDNPGGYVDAVIEVADQFVDDGLLMVADGPTDHREYDAAAGGLTTSQRLLVLVNRGTASAAEIMTGALRDRREAVVIGTNTFGKDAVQIPFTLRNGGEFHVAVARWSTPNGDTAGNGGLSPDREVIWPDGASVDEIVGIALEAAS
ncbi:MAG TPA: S41 family peptidase [Acidimicrobiia bacterium]|nr:S41 family peptidase [Acidimicrobiia bacterium]